MNKFKEIVNKFIYTVIFGYSLLFNSLDCSAQVKLTLQKAIDSALNRNLLLKQAQLSFLLSKETLKQSKFNLLPTLNSTTESSFNWGRTLDVSTYSYINQRVSLTSGNIGAQVSLFQGGQLRKQIVQNRLLLESDQSNVAKVKNDITLSVATVFLQILAEQELLATANQQINIANLKVEKIQKGMIAGNKSTMDLSQTLSQLANTELDQVTIQNQLNSSILTLKQLINMLDSTIEIVKPDISKLPPIKNTYDTTAIITQALAANPSVHMAMLQKEAALQGVKISKSFLYPSLFLYGSVGTNFSSARALITGSKPIGYDTTSTVTGTNQRVLTPIYNNVYQKYPFIKQFSDNFYQSVGFTMQIPIINRYNTKINISKAKINYQNAIVTAQLEVNNLTKIINQALIDLHTSEKRLAIAQRNYNATKQVLYASEKRYQVGIMNFLDYNITIINFNKAEFDLIQARYDLIFKGKIIDYYLGKSLNIE